MSTDTETTADSTSWPVETTPDVSQLGSCWDPPAADVVPVFVPDFPLARVLTWTTSPGHEQWGDCLCTTEDLLANPRLHDDLNGGHLEFDGCRVKEYAADLLRGDIFPAVNIFHRPDDPDEDHGPWLVDDGFHRASAAHHIGLNVFPAWVWDEA